MLYLYENENDEGDIDTIKAKQNWINRSIFKEKCNLLEYKVRSSLKSFSTEKNFIFLVEKISKALVTCMQTDIMSNWMTLNWNTMQEMALWILFFSFLKTDINL